MIKRLTVEGRERMGVKCKSLVDCVYYRALTVTQFVCGLLYSASICMWVTVQYVTLYVGYCALRQFVCGLK